MLFLYRNDYNLLVSSKTELHFGINNYLSEYFQFDMMLNLSDGVLMLAKPLYEILPYVYMALGSSSFITLDINYAMITATVIFILGARIYIQRSQNRRTDPARRRKSGYFPEVIYNFLPFIYLFAALSIFKFMPKDLYPLLAICLLSYSLYILLRRALYRRHRLPASPHF